MDWWARVREAGAEALREEGEKWVGDLWIDRMTPPEQRESAIIAFVSGGEYVIGVIEAALATMRGLESGVVD